MCCNMIKRQIDLAIRIENNIQRQAWISLPFSLSAILLNASLNSD